MNQLRGKLAEANKLLGLADEPGGDDPRLRARYHEQSCRMQWAMGRLDEAVARGKRALELTIESGDERSAARIESRLAHFARDLGRVGEAHKRFERAIRIQRDIRDLYGLMVSLNNFAGLQMFQGRFSESLDSFDEALQVSRTIRQTRFESIVVHDIAETHITLGRLSQGLDLAEQAAGLAEKVRDQRFVSFAHFLVAFVGIQLGDADRAIEKLRPAISWLNDNGDARFAVFGEMLICEALLSARRYLNAGQMAEDVGRKMAELGDEASRQRTLLTVAYSQLGAGMRSEAAQTFAAAIEIGTGGLPEYRAGAEIGALALGVPGISRQRVRHWVSRFSCPRLVQLECAVTNADADSARRWINASEYSDRGLVGAKLELLLSAGVSRKRST